MWWVLKKCQILPIKSSESFWNYFLLKILVQMFRIKILLQTFFETHHVQFFVSLTLCWFTKEFVDLIFTNCLRNFIETLGKSIKWNIKDKKGQKRLDINFGCSLTVTLQQQIKWHHPHFWLQFYGSVTIHF